MLCCSAAVVESDGFAESEVMEAGTLLLAVLLYSDRLTRFRKDRLEVGFFRKLENLAPFLWNVAEVCLPCFLLTFVLLFFVEFCVVFSVVTVNSMSFEFQFYHGQSTSSPFRLFLLNLSNVFDFQVYLHTMAGKQMTSMNSTCICGIYHRLLIKLQLFQIPLIKKFVSHELSHFMLNFPRFCDCTHVASKIHSRAFFSSLCQSNSPFSTTSINLFFFLKYMAKSLGICCCRRCLGSLRIDRNDGVPLYWSYKELLTVIPSSSGKHCSCPGDRDRDINTPLSYYVFGRRFFFQRIIPWLGSKVFQMAL
ncbi:hypothetical protein AGLY_001461 [Aphis glycines]|uniref:Uncharacterized protein n=1 Tax=Aphis glycines TaxID=307491 RepID=A0A6G0U7M4_APHGL|nr:hypothetical protein AGLY_001461 [Aphis glycines]